MKIPHINRLSTTSKLIHHPQYALAKQGHFASARILIDSFNIDYSRFSTFSGFICPVRKLSGNKIPLALAQRISENSNLTLIDSIILENNKQGNSMLHRMFFKPQYSGTFPAGKYIIVDDVFTTGITLKGLKDYIESSGSVVNSIYTLGSTQHGLKFEASNLKMRILKAKFPNIEQFFDLTSLSHAQVNYLLRFNSPYQYFENQYLEQSDYINNLNLQS
jgi:hypoxanthine phosphoribosyltransferase